MTLCTTCIKANKTCPVYPLDTDTCVEYIAINKPCPFCGGTDLIENLWSLDGGEVDALECSSCNGAAPLKSWNQRQFTLPLSATKDK